MDDRPSPEPKPESSNPSRHSSGPNVSIGGNVSGNVEVADGDIIHGNVVTGDQLTVSNIKDSAISIGPNARATRITGAGLGSLAEALAEILTRLDALQETDPVDIADAKATAGEIVGAAMEGEEISKGFLAERFRNLARMGPDILDVVTTTILNPALGISRTVRLIAEKARDDAGLEPV